MTQFFIKLTFAEKRLFVKAYDCGYFSTLTQEPQIVENIDCAVNQPINPQENEEGKTYDVYVLAEKLGREDVEQALIRLKQHYPQGYVAITETNQFPNQIHQNVMAALQHQEFLLQKKWGVVAFHSLGFFKPHCKFPPEIQNQILSHFKVAWNNDHLENTSKNALQEENLKLIDEMAAFSEKHIRRG